MSGTKQGFAETRLGKLGAFLPLLCMVFGILIMSLCGMRGIKNMWAACFLGIVVGWLVIKDSKKFMKAVSDGVRDPVLGAMIPIFFVSGILGKILSAAHMGDGVLYWISKLNVSPAWMPLVIFVCAGILSVGSGSSSAALSALPAVLLPVAYAMGCDPGLSVAAIISGAILGDNLAPISDSCIASAMTQEVDVSKTFRYRVKYSLGMAIVCGALYAFFGFRLNAGTSSESLVIDPVYASSVVFLVVPILIIVIMLKNGNFFNAMLIGELVGVAMLFLFGYATPATVFAGDGLIASGISAMTDGVIFIIFIFIIISLTKATGCMEIIQDATLKVAGKGGRGNEIIAGLMAVASACIVASGTSAINFCGPVVRGIMKPTKISRARTASIIGGICQSVGYMVPWCVTAVMFPGIIISLGAAPETFTATDWTPYLFYNFALLIVYWGLILTGFDKKIETDEELAADGIVLDK